MDEPQVAGSFDELFAAAREEAKRSEITLPWWGDTAVRVRRASAEDHARLVRQIREGLKAGEHIEEDTLLAMAWVTVCVYEPKLTADQVFKLWQEAPADVSKLASICQAVSSGMRMTDLMLNAWGSAAMNVREAVDKGQVGPGVLHFWTSLIRSFRCWLDSGGGMVLNYRDLGRALMDLDEGAEAEEATDALKSWARQQDDELGNALAEESSTSSASASSGQDDAQTNLPSTDGPSTTSTDSAP